MIEMKSRTGWLGAIGVTCALVAGMAGVATSSGASGSAYRTVTATKATVAERLALDGTVSVSGRADLTFGADGTVTKVLVDQGDKVRTGQVIARTSETDARRALQRAESELQSARAQLEADLATQADAVMQAASATAGPPTGSAAPAASPASAWTPAIATTTTTALVNSPGGETPTIGAAATRTESTFVTGAADQPADATATDAALQAAMAQLPTQQQAVLSAQTAATEALTTASTALDTQVQTCAVDPAAVACADALATVQVAQQATATAQHDLQDALAALSHTLTTAIAALDAAAQAQTDAQAQADAQAQEEEEDEQDQQAQGAPGADTHDGDKDPQQGGQDSPGQGDASDGQRPDGQPSDQAPAPDATGEKDTTGSRSETTGRSVTAATIAQDQAAIDAANVSVLKARTQLDLTELTAPTGGTLRALDLAVGDEVTTDQVVAILTAKGATTVTAEVNVDDIDDVDEGQAVDVTTLGSDEPAHARVTTVAAAPTSGASTYTVEVTLNASDTKAPIGTPASMEIVTASVEDVVAVPTSAITTSPSASVLVLAHGATSRRPVSLGARGPIMTEIAEGLEAGDVVVLADLTVQPPAGESSTTPGRSGGAGGGVGGGVGGRRR